MKKKNDLNYLQETTKSWEEKEEQAREAAKKEALDAESVRNAEFVRKMREHQFPVLQPIQPRTSPPPYQSFQSYPPHYHAGGPSGPPPPAARWPIRNADPRADMRLYLNELYTMICEIDERVVEPKSAQELHEMILDLREELAEIREDLQS